MQIVNPVEFARAVASIADAPVAHAQGARENSAFAAAADALGKMVSGNSEVDVALARANDFLAMLEQARNAAQEHANENPDDFADAQQAFELAQSTVRQISEMKQGHRPVESRQLSQMLTVLGTAATAVTQEVHGHEGAGSKDGAKRQAHVASQQAKQNSQRAQEQEMRRAVQEQQALREVEQQRIIAHEAEVAAQREEAAHGNVLAAVSATMASGWQRMEEDDGVVGVVTRNAGRAVNAVRDGVGDAVGTTRRVVGRTVNAVRDGVGDAVDTTRRVAGRAADAVGDAVDTTRRVAGRAVDTVRDAAGSARDSAVNAFGQTTDAVRRGYDAARSRMPAALGGMNAEERRGYHRAVLHEALTPAIGHLGNGWKTTKGADNRNFDINGDGRISAEELRWHLNQAGIMKLEDIDRDRNGQLSSTEIHAALGRVQRHAARD